MSELISQFVAGLRKRKKEAAFAFFCFLMFLVLLFPFDDLSDLITEMVAKNTQNQVFLSFDKLGLKILPPGVRMENVTVDTAFMPTLKTNALALSPSIAGFLSFRPGFVASASGLFSGDLSLTYKTGKEVADGVNFQLVDLGVSDVNLQEVSRFGSLPLELNGQGDAQISAEVDPGFGKQPTGDYEIELKKVRIPPATLSTAMGPIDLPNMEFSGIKLKGRMVAGDFFLEEATLGKPGDGISGRIKGRIRVTLARVGNQVVPRFGAYQFKFDLTFDRAAAQNFGLFLGFYDKYKTLTGNGSRYAFQLSGSALGAPPTDQPLTSF
jgi:type II secretion system protein N